MLDFNEDERTIEPKMPVEQMSGAQVRMVLDNAALITAWINAVQKYAHDELEAGRDPAEHRYKLVPKRPVRAWLDPEDVADTLCMVYGLGDEDIFEEPKMKSPAKIETTLSAQAVGLPRKEAASRKKDIKKFVESLVSSVSSGNTLVHISDKREAVTRGPVTDFDED